MATPPTPLQQNNAQPIPRKTGILVVDDINAMRNLNMSLLRGLELENVHGAANGREALNLLQQRPFDVIVSDWNMPVMDGYELLCFIRSDPKLFRLPFVMITAEADRNRINQAIAAGVTGMLIKPYKSGHLGDRIAHAMRIVPPAQPRPRAAPPVPSFLAKSIPATDTAAASPAPVSAPPAPVSTPADGTRPIVLIVDDDPGNLSLLTSMFKDDYRVRAATNGARALEICCSDAPPDLVLLDIMMPDMDGFEVAKRMREHPASETIPIIFVTGLTDDDARMKGLALGAIDFVTKPIDPNILKPRVQNLLRYIGLHKQLQGSFDTMAELARLRENVDHMVRHDLKGPLAGIVGLTQALAAQAGKDAPQLLELIQMIESQTSQVIDLVSQASELMKIESGNFTLLPQDVDILATLHQVATALQATYASKNINIVTRVRPDGARPQVAGDPSLCFSILNNLVKNACEAAPHGQVTITVNVPAKAQDVSITLHNFGAVPEAIRDRFFQKFVTHGKSGGTGLGAYSAKRLSEAMNGRLEMATSDDEDSTTLTLSLPLATGK